MSLSTATFLEDLGAYKLSLPVLVDVCAVFMSPVSDPSVHADVP